MTKQTTQTAVETKMTKAETQRLARKRFSFGKVWTAAVKEGKVTDRAKLVEHGVKLKAGKRYDLKQLRFETLLAKVQKALVAQEAEVVATPTAEE
jgi:hypothetical protein